MPIHPIQAAVSKDLIQEAADNLTKHIELSAIAGVDKEKALIDVKSASMFAIRSLYR